MLRPEVALRGHKVCSAVHPLGLALSGAPHEWPAQHLSAGDHYLMG